MGWGDDYQKYIATSHFCADDFNLTSLYVRDLPCFSKDSIDVMDKWLKEQLAWYPAKLGDLQLHQGFVRIDIPKDYRSGQPQEELTDTPVYSDKSFALARPFPTSWPDNDGPYQERVACMTSTSFRMMPIITSRMCTGSILTRTTFCLSMTRRTSIPT